MSGTINPTSMVWTKQSTRLVETAAGTNVVEVWVGPKSTEDAFKAGYPFGTQHPDVLTALLKSRESDPDDSQTLGRVTITYEQPEASSGGLPIGPVGTDTLTLEIEPFDAPPISPGQADFGGPGATTEYRYVFRRTQVLSTFTWTITAIEGYRKGALGAGNGDAGAAAPGVTGGTPTNWSQVLESVREADNAVEVVTRHTYSTA